MIALPILFAMNLVVNLVVMWESPYCSPHYLCNELGSDVVVNTYLQQILENAERSTKRRADEPNAIDSFSLSWHKWDTFSSLSTSCGANWVSGMYPELVVEPGNFSSSACISYLRMVLIINYECIHLIINFNPCATRLFLHTRPSSLLLNYFPSNPSHLSAAA